MARKLTKTELARKDLIDMVRTRKRLEHRIALRHELNELEEVVLDEFDERVMAGEPHELTIDAADALVKQADK